MLKKRYRKLILLTIFLILILNWYTNNTPEKQTHKKISNSKSTFICRLQNYSNFDASDETLSPQNVDYSNRAAQHLRQNYRVTRALLVYLSLDQLEHFTPELKWFYLSWTNLLEHEPSKWRTDLIIFLDYSSYLHLFNAIDSNFFLNELDCRLTNRRSNSMQKPMCTLIDYKPLRKRSHSNSTVQDQLTSIEFAFKSYPSELYSYFLHELDPFELSQMEMRKYEDFLIENIRSYPYVDSLLIAFYGYPYLKEAGYSFVMKTDLDSFLLPRFAQWLPIECDDFYVGRGGYSALYNRNKLKKAAAQLNLSFSDAHFNIGSSWISTSEQLNTVAFYSSILMAYLANEEFTSGEKQFKVGNLLWPDWHYGVLSMYSSHLALSHLATRNRVKLKILDELVDWPTDDDTTLIGNKLHLHCYHSEKLFSKYSFKNGTYDSMSLSDKDLKFVKYYALNLALESKRTSFNDLYYKFMLKAYKKV